MEIQSFLDALEACAPHDMYGIVAAIILQPRGGYTVEAGENDCCDFPALGVSCSPKAGGHGWGS